jgi:hypothetical protein
VGYEHGFLYALIVVPYETNEVRLVKLTTAGSLVSIHDLWITDTSGYFGFGFGSGIVSPLPAT